MSTVPSPDRHLPSTGARPAFYVAVGLVAVVLVVLLAADAAGVFVPRFTRDPISPEARLGTSYLSLLGGLAWASAATMLGGAGLLRRVEDGAPSAASRLLLGSALFTAVLCLDDTLALHESTKRIGDAAEAGVGLLYLALALTWLALCRPLSDRRHAPTVVLAGVLLAASLAVDTLLDVADADLLGTHAAVVEDATKVAGIAAYVVWAASVSWDAVRDRPRRPQEAVDLPGAERQPTSTA